MAQQNVWGRNATLTDMSELDSKALSTKLIPRVYFEGRRDGLLERVGRRVRYITGGATKPLDGRGVTITVGITTGLKDGGAIGLALGAGVGGVIGWALGSGVGGVTGAGVGGEIGLVVGGM